VARSSAQTIKRRRRVQPQRQGELGNDTAAETLDESLGEHQTPKWGRKGRRQLALDRDGLELTGPQDEDWPELDIVPLIDVLMYKATSKRWNDAVVNRISINSMIRVKCPTVCHVERDHIAGTSNGPQKAFASVRVAGKPRL
jgi:hypothetical protein